MNSPKTINHEYLPPTMRFIIAGAIGLVFGMGYLFSPIIAGAIAEFRNTASKAAKAKMAPAK